MAQIKKQTKQKETNKMRKEQTTYTWVFVKSPPIYKKIFLYITGWKKRNNKIYTRLGD